MIVLSNFLFYIATKNEPRELGCGRIVDFQVTISAGNSYIGAYVGHDSSKVRKKKREREREKEGDNLNVNGERCGI